MTFKYMLDTNAISGLINDPAGAVAKHIEIVGEDSICCSVVVASELRYGAAKKKSEALSRRVDAALAAMAILPISEPVDRVYAQIRADLTGAGTSIGPNDLFIAAHALSEKLTLVTANLREFQRVSSLSVENWE